MHIVAPDSNPSDIQIKAIREAKLMTSRRNLIIAGPTNSGKTLLAYMALLRGMVQKGKRVLLLEPLRAIAQEKFDELECVAETMKGTLGRRIGVVVTTGDYRLSEETMQSPPPDGGEIVIATPERLEAIMRNPEFDEWINSFAVVVVDEAPAERPNAGWNTGVCDHVLQDV
ncbi:MAG: DEAD/DEAH box helicase [Verrucomicrobiales bacterium]